MSDSPRVDAAPDAVTEVMQRRHDAVRATVAAMRAGLGRGQPDRAALDSIKAPLLALAARTALFPRAGFAVPAGRLAALYELSVDADLGFALYVSAGLPGKFQPPHNHTTWAVIAGVCGAEHNVFYELADGGLLLRRGEQTVRRGDAVALLGDDFHTIAVPDADAAAAGGSLHLHLYGRSLEHLPKRVFFADATGGVAERFMARPELLSPLVSAADVRAMLADGAELALIDVREGGIHAQGHPLLATSLPMSVLELRAPVLLPRRDVRLVLCADDEALPQAAARKLRAHGYRNIAVLGGGIAAWRAAGNELFSGVFVPSKAFGEFVEHTCETPRIDADTLHAWQAEGRPLLVLDSRPPGEFQTMSIPGAMNCPGAELVYRAPALLPTPDTVVVVNCAGRTRSIIGAQSLINAGLPNPVYALQNGTMGWQLSGREVARGRTELAPRPDGASLRVARAMADAVAARFHIARIDAVQLRALQGYVARTTYVFYVRLEADYRAGHRAGALSAPGGQLVQSTDAYAAVRHARLVLVDDDGVQAVMTAHWLKQMGWRDVLVLDSAAEANAARVTGEDPPPGLDEAAQSTLSVSVDELRVALARREVEVIDIGASLSFRRAHIPGAWYANRSRLGVCLARFPLTTPLVFTSSDGRLARYAATDAGALGHAARWLRGGTQAWLQAGLPGSAVTGDDDPTLLTATDDAWYPPYARSTDVAAAMQAYLDWEVNLVAQMRGETYLRFTTTPD